MNRSVPSTVDTTWEGAFSLIGFGNGLAGLMFTIYLRLNRPVFGAFPFTSLSTYRLKIGIILANRVCSFDLTQFRERLTILKPNIARKLTILRKRNLSICKSRSNTVFQTSSSSALRRSNNLRKIRNFRFEIFFLRKSAIKWYNFILREIEANSVVVCHCSTDYTQCIQIHCHSSGTGFGTGNGIGGDLWMEI